MLREEAEREADRRNREDPDRERFEFYAFDESAGMSAQAWDVAARLRQGPRTDRPATAAAATGHGHAVEVAPQETALHAEPAPHYTEPPAEYAEPAHHDAEPAAEYADPETVYAEPEVYAAPEPYVEEAPEENGDRPGWLVRTVGAVVVVTGLLWMAMVVALAVFLNPDDATTFAVYIGAAVLGLTAIALGVAIRRS